MLNIMLKYLFNLKKNQWLDKKTIDEIKWKKLLENINYAYENVPYYKEQLKYLNFNPKNISSKKDILNIPLTTKQDLLQSKFKYISNKYEDKQLYTSKTSGSTGEPFVSYFDKKAWTILKFASKFRARHACGFSFKEKFIIIEAMGIKEANDYNSSIKLSHFVIRKRFLSVYDTLENHILFYKKFKPTSIYGFPSYFVNLVSYLDENSVKLDFVKRIFTSSEILDKFSRKIIEDYFNCKVNDIYGSTETKEVSWECPKHEGYHINEDLIYVECIDDDGKPVKNGKEGRIVLTSLENKAMPLLRYCIEDRGVLLNKKCSCGRGFSLMKPIYGRIIDYFILTDGRKISPYELTMSVEGIAGIMQYQIVQKTKSLVEITLKTNKKFLPKSKDIIISNLKSILGNDVKVVLKLIDSFNNNNSSNTRIGKFRVVISEVKK